MLREDNFTDSLELNIMSIIWARSCFKMKIIWTIKLNVSSRSTFCIKLISSKFCMKKLWIFENMLGSYRRFHSTVFEETTLYGMVVATYRRFI
jgi:hypothetical protein